MIGIEPIDNIYQHTTKKQAYNRLLIVLYHANIWYCRYYPTFRTPLSCLLSLWWLIHPKIRIQVRLSTLQPDTPDNSYGNVRRSFTVGIVIPCPDTYVYMVTASHASTELQLIILVTALFNLSAPFSGTQCYGRICAHNITQLPSYTSFRHTPTLTKRDNLR